MACFLRVRKLCRRAARNDDIWVRGRVGRAAHREGMWVRGRATKAQKKGCTQRGHVGQREGHESPDEGLQAKRTCGPEGGPRKQGGSLSPAQETALGSPEGVALRLRFSVDLIKLRRE